MAFLRNLLLVLLLVAVLAAWVMLPWPGALLLAVLFVGWLLGIALMAAIGLVVGALPAWSAMRLNIVDALAGR